MRFFSAKQPLEPVAVYFLDPLPKMNERNQLILVMGDRITNLTRVVSLKRTTDIGVFKAF